MKYYYYSTKEVIDAVKNTGKLLPPSTRNLDDETHDRSHDVIGSRDTVGNGMWLTSLSPFNTLRSYVASQYFVDTQLYGKRYDLTLS